MYLFDTDHLTIMDRGGPSAQILLAKLLTRNKSDFERIEGLIFEDWTS
jgi:hypothetical protein